MESVLGHGIGSSETANLSSQLPLSIILETEKCDMEHSVHNILTGHQALDEAKPGVANVGEGCCQVAVAGHTLLPAEQLLVEHLALGRPSCAAARGNRAAANVPAVATVEANQCVQLGVEEGLASEGHRPC